MSTPPDDPILPETPVHYDPVPWSLADVLLAGCIAIGVALLVQTIIAIANYHPAP